MQGNPIGQESKPRKILLKFFVNHRGRLWRRPMLSQQKAETMMMMMINTIRPMIYTSHTLATSRFLFK